MSEDREVIREFLISLGFNVNAIDARRFGQTLENASRLAGQTAAVVASVTVAAEAMVQTFAHGMEKMYYSSRRNRSTVSELQGIEYGVKQIGLNAETAAEAMENFSSNLRMNPGVTALLKNLGVKTSGSNVEKFNGLLEKLSKMPHQVGASYAELFMGMDERTFTMYMDKLPEYLAAEKERIALNEKAGIDADKWAEASRNYMNALRGVWTEVEILGQKIAVKLLPFFQDFMGATREALGDLISFKSGVEDIDMGEWGDQLKDISKNLAQFSENLQTFIDNSEHLRALWWLIKDLFSKTAHIVGDMVEGVAALLGGDLKGAWNAYKKTWTHLFETPESSGEKVANASLSGQGGAPSGIKPTRRPSSTPGSSTDAQALFAGLEATYGLPSGLLDKMWKQESGRGTNMVSKAGALGHFQFMPKTAAQYGVKDPNDLGQAAGGAAAMMGDLMRKYGGSVPHALAAYNWGGGNLDKKGLGAAPSETRDYVKKISGQDIAVNSNTVINVNGAGDPSQVANNVANKQNSVNNVVRDSLRNVLVTAR